MPRFNLWSAYAPSDDVIEFDVTMADADLIDRGSAAFSEACIRALGDDRSVVSWSFEPVRQQYYSDYPSSDDWRARWDLAWCARVHVREKRRPPPLRLLACPEQVSQAADCDPEADEPLLAAGPVLLIAVFAADSPAEWNSWASDLTALVPDAGADVTVRRYDVSGVVQVRIQLPSVVLPRDVARLEAALSRARVKGAAVSRLEVDRLLDRG